MAPIERICVYCGSSTAVDPVYLEAAYTLGGLMGRARIGLVYGGGRTGLMGRVADGALAEGGHVIGIIPQSLRRRELAHRSLGELVVVATMHERKEGMATRSDAFVVLPGGLGTLDELFEILTWRQLGFHEKPIIVVDLAGYWAPLRRLIDHTVSAGFTRAVDLDLLHFVDDVADVLPALLG